VVKTLNAISLQPFDHFDEIWYNDASQPDEKPKISKFQNPRRQMAAIIKIEKS